MERLPIQNAVFHVNVLFYLRQNKQSRLVGSAEVAKKLGFSGFDFNNAVTF
jgi:hypothetical protein